MIDRYARPAMKRVWSEENKYDKWLQVEIAACEGWAAMGEIPEEDLAKLRRARYDSTRIDHFFQETRHDVTAFLRSVAESLGPESRFVHMGLTSSDVMDTALGLQLMEAADILAENLADASDAVRQRALEHKYTIMMGRTHGVHAEPTTLGLKLALWLEELKRNALRLSQAREAIAVGKVSGAVGTHATVPLKVEEIALARLDLKVDPVSSQIIQRDRHAQFVATLALLAASLEKFATEIRGLQRTEVLEAEEPFSEGQTGSSAMPHKRNPELSERICGLARLVRGHAVTALENVALWHERDISHSSAERLILPDSCMALDYMLAIFTQIMRELNVYPERMRQNIDLTHGLVFSQRVLLALIERGLGRQDAYKTVQTAAMKAWGGHGDFRSLLEQDPAVTKLLAPHELHDLFDLRYYTRYVDEIFARLNL